MREELIRLRQAMAQAKIDAYVVPTDDFHGSEYVGAFFRCRAYVSGFTGSAGTLVVTQDWAGLWTDGRYFLQGAQQLKGSGIELCKMGQPEVPTVEQWLEAHMQAGQVLGFDGRSMTSGTGKSLEQAMERKGAKICYDQDLVGQIWEARPPMSTAPAWELDEKYAGRSRRDKLETLKRDVKALGADSYILTSLDDLAWLLNIRGDDVACCPVVLGDLLLDQTGLWLYTDEKKFSPELRAALAADGVQLRPYLSLYEDVKSLATNSTVLLDPKKVNFSILKNIPQSVTVLEDGNPTELPKSTKTQVECDNERIAHIRDGVALTRFMKWVKEHVGKEPITEISAAKKLEGFRSQMEGYLGPSFDPIMGYGSNGAIIHYSATPESDTALEPRSFLLADTGGHYLQGSTDVTRTFVLGPLTQEMRHHYTLVLRGNLNLGAAVFKDGCTGISLDYIARKPFWDEGLDYNHGTGHGVGYLLSVHEGPQNIRYRNTSGRPDVAMAPGMITSNEPGFYLEGQYGIRLENLMCCEKRQENEYGTFLGFETLTMCPFELDAILPEELSPREKALLNAYHQKVYETIAPYFDEEEKAWLKNATRAI
jgi:Xaa-Pro aminopeptidase